MLAIHTERLRLRDFRDTDFDAVHAYVSDPEVARYVAFGSAPEDAREFLAQAVAQQTAAPRVEHLLAIEHAGDSTVIGSIGLHPYDLPNRTFEIGYLLSRTYWGQGLVQEAVRAVIEMGFTALGAHRIIATCDVRNTASYRVMEKLGLRREGCLRRDKQVRGEWRGSYLYAILADEWHTR